MAPMHRSARAEHWQRIVDRFHSSGLSVAQFSKKYRISAQSLYQWRRKLLPQTETAATASKKDAEFLPVRIIPAVAMDQTLASKPDAGLVQIRTPRGYLIRCSANLPASQLAELIRAIESTHCEGDYAC